jgi:hypothetical protein
MLPRDQVIAVVLSSSPPFTAWPAIGDNNNSHFKGIGLKGKEKRD